MGGGYTEGNVITVEVVKCDMQTANHAMWHYANWRLYGKEEDIMAWKGLSGFFNKEDIIKKLQDLGRSRIDRKALGIKLKIKFEEDPSLRQKRGEEIREAFDRLDRADPEWKERRRKAISDGGNIEKSLQTRRENKIGFYNSNWQREMGSRGGRKVAENRLGFLREGVYNDPVRKARGGRASCLSRQGVKLLGKKHYPESFGYRTYLSSDFVNYFIHYGLPKI